MNVLEYINSPFQHYYDAVDKYMADAAKDLSFSCKKGCYHCCRQMVLATIPECIFAISKVIEEPSWQTFNEDYLKPTIAAQINGFLEVSLDPVAWFKTKTDCIFLKNNICMIYENRPLICRTHVSLDPSKVCEEGAKDIRTIDSKTILHNGFEMSKVISRRLDFNWEQPLSLPNGILMALVFYEDGPSTLREKIEESKVVSARSK